MKVCILVGRAFLSGSIVMLALSSVTTAEVSESFAGNIILGRPTDRAVTVNVLFPGDHDAVYLEYGDQQGKLRSTTRLRRNIRANVPYEEIISGLEPNRRYHYRVCYRKSGDEVSQASSEHTFHTQRARGSTFTFTVVADSHLFTQKHCDPERYALTLQNARDDHPDFHIDLGDTFRSDTIVKNPGDLTYQRVLEREIAHRPFFGILTHSAPLFLVLGNHDSEYLYYTRPESGMNPNLPVWATNARKALFPNPAPDAFYTGNQTAYPEIDGGLRENYYAWEWGDALFVVLDPYWELSGRGGSGWDPMHGDEQYQWFRDTLQNSDARYKFVFEHHVLGQSRGGVELARNYEWGGHDPKGRNTFEEMRPGWEKPMHDLMAENGVNIYFQGHDHLFARGESDGVTYVTVPMPGAAPDPEDPDFFPGNEDGGNADAYYSSLVLGNSGHIRVRVSPAGVKVDYISVKLPGRDRGANGQVAHTFTIDGWASPLAMVSGASFVDSPAAPDSIISAFGEELTGPDGACEITVTDSRAVARVAESLFTSPRQVNFVIPEGTALGPAVVDIVCGGETVAAGDIVIEPLSPGLFSANGNGSGVAAAIAARLDNDGSPRAWPIFHCESEAGSCVAEPIDLGDGLHPTFLSLYGTGIRYREQLSDVVAQIGAEPAEILYAGPQGTYTGLDQVNLILPATLAGRGEVPVSLTVAGKTANVVTVNVQ